MLPEESEATPLGLLKEAEVAAPPSPELAEVPFPARVEM